ncbi:MAG TPA: hypothetical protein DCE56_41955 [Cyanobacteria bacterium UBA8553]|nr:hypothetical protein [Cyanobacteria bacterium UBA8553]HAJ58066.1 hypothetical protein [Cyanobacteria bacterium UBA8543]
MINYKKLVSIYLPEELYQALINYQEQRGIEETSRALSEILAQFFHKDSKVKRYATVEELEVLEAKVTHLGQQVAQLCEVIASSTPPEAARTVATLGSEYTRPALSAQQSTIDFESNSFEEEEDEPDEILYDFLEPESPPSSSK